MAAFPRMTLDEEEGELFVREVALLADPDILGEAVDQIIRREERFPTIATLRAYYRTCNDARKPRTPALPRGDRDDGIPEWVQVWFWHSSITRSDRQKQNTTSRQPVDDRAPVAMRPFPQMRGGYVDEFTGHIHNDDEPLEGAYTMEEYEAIRAAWVESGAPSISSAVEIFALL